MTLGEFIQHLGDNPFYPLFYFFILPIAALLGNFMAKGEGHLSPWCIILSMLLTLFLIKKNVDFKDIPGFGKLTGFVGTIAGLMLIFFVLDKMHLIVFSYLPIQWLAIVLVVAFFVIRFVTKKVFA